jgi:small subunit ribosomal protein S9
VSETTIEAPTEVADDAADTATAPADAAAPADVADDAAPGSYTSESTTPAPAARRAAAGPGAATGRRKEAIARVRIAPGTGQWKINARSLDDYFPNKVHQQIVNEPFEILDQGGQYDVIARIVGGGVTGQAGALRLGVARALIEADAENRPSLKKAGFLTRDARVKERKKYGLKKARKAPQYSKR